MALEERFNTSLIAALASREKQIQQTYRPVIGIHKWFARRPGTLFRGLLLSEFCDEPLSESFFKGNRFEDKVIADPFMGGGTPLIEANRMGMKVIGCDINPMAYWIVRQALAPLDISAFKTEAERVAAQVESEIGHLYETECNECGAPATVKYFLWVKSYRCEACGEPNDLFPGYLIATNDRHTSFVSYCPECEQLVEVHTRPDKNHTVPCPYCHKPLPTTAAAQRGKFRCRRCNKLNHYPNSKVPEHRMFAMEYYCHHCHNRHKGRYFKVPTAADLERFAKAKVLLQQHGDELIPADEIPEGDETNRLHRWGYKRYRELFNDRQLLGLQTLLRAIQVVENREIRLALATVFSDMLRYQNMLCRYDTMALKCQDIFSVHGFPVGLVQCENNLLGISQVGSGGFRHFVDKYLRAKRYCQEPFEVVTQGSRKRQVYTHGERIEADFAAAPSEFGTADAYLFCGDSSELEIQPDTLDGVFTDPPYFDNVQYAELADFCYVWIRQLLAKEDPAFTRLSTRNPRELTGNATLGRGINEFTEGLSGVFQRVAAGLKRGAPLVFTYHHNSVEAYLPLIVAILDAGLMCTDTLATPAEMTASLHINGTGSSIIDSIFVCRKGIEEGLFGSRPFPDSVEKDVAAIQAAGVRVTAGDVICITLGHMSRLAIQTLSVTWNRDLSTAERLNQARVKMEALLRQYPLKVMVDAFVEKNTPQGRRTVF